MKIELNIDYFEEDGVIVALSPELQVSSFGDTLAEAEKSIKEALELFFEGCETLGTLNEVLEESGFRKKSVAIFSPFASNKTRRYFNERS
jgi:predicted RNase H-like HicB family nuclease